MLGAALLANAARADDETAALQRLVDAGQAPWLAHAPSPDEADALRRLYTPRQYAPLWLHDRWPTAQADAVIAALGAADADGLAPLDYDAPRLAAEAPRIAGADADTAALFDVALSLAAMRYATHAAVGRVAPRTVGFDFDVAPKRPDAAALVAGLAEDPDPRARLQALDPPFPAFARLRDTLADYRALSRTALPPVPDLPKLKPGDSHPQLAALRARLTALGDLPADAAPPADPTHYDETLAAAVRAFQRRHGLADDAVVGPSTLRTLQTPPVARVQQIELAMERMRWLPYSWPARFVFVNIPEFRLRGFAAGSATPQLAMNVVVGQAASKEKHKTPVLQADMTYLVFRPYWMVPSSIANRELWPKISNDPGYLDRNNMLVSNGRIRQRPGRGNSLGLLKFIFPNPHHVYLHDTPSKGLFARSRRDFSHGCIRVSDPPALAEFVLTGMDGWDRARIDMAMKSGPDDRHVTLGTPVPVYIFYTTVVVDEAGGVLFFDDIYGHDATLQRQLAKGFPYAS
ncbi:MAG: L,D-transpeptidase family protein [Deltaproteobacteria bacterium]|nr:L,D-transpeptidase family protein [Deltaproteobacteria bacterium]